MIYNKEELLKSLAALLPETETLEKGTLHKLPSADNEPVARPYSAVHVKSNKHGDHYDLHQNGQKVGSARVVNSQMLDTKTGKPTGHAPGEHGSDIIIHHDEHDNRDAAGAVHEAHARNDKATQAMPSYHGSMHLVTNNPKVYKKIGKKKEEIKQAS